MIRKTITASVGTGRVFLYASALMLPVSSWAAGAHSDWLSTPDGRISAIACNTMAEPNHEPYYGETEKSRQEQVRSKYQSCMRRMKADHLREVAAQKKRKAQDKEIKRILLTQ